MTYFYKMQGTIARKIGGEPPAEEYVAIDPKGIVRHIKKGEILEEEPITYPKEYMEAPELKDFYMTEYGKQMAREMLFPKYRKKKTSSKPTRKIKVDKKCTCK